MQKTFAFTYTTQPLNEIDSTWKSLLQKAQEAAEKAYAPYSQFRVGAAALTKSGKIVVGCNQENASYPVGICAERNLLVGMETLGAEPILRILVYSPDSTNLLSPCGMCRQALLEYETRFDSPLACMLIDGNVALVVDNVQALLPFGFDASSL